MKLTPTLRQTCMLVIGFSFLAVSTVCAQSQSVEGIKLGFFGGASVPEGGIANVYDVLTSQGAISSYNAARNMGSHFGAKVRVGVSESVSLTASASYNRFAQMEQQVSVAGIPLPTFLTSASYIPATAGVTWIPIRSFVMVGLSGELVYSYKNVGMTESQRQQLEQDIERLNVNVDASRFQYQRSGIGAAIGAMVGVNVLGIQPYLEVKHIWTNALMQEQNDPVSSFYQISIGLML